MSIITPSYFKNDLYIPNAEPTAGGANNYAALQDCINMVEGYILKNAFGLTLYNELVAALPIVVESDDKWKWLVNGREYDGKSWIGLANDKSPIAYAVYAAFLDINSHFWTTTGTMHPNPENSQAVSPTFKIATAWQNFIRKYQNGCHYESYIEIGYDYVFTDYFGSHEDVEVSLYQYMSDNKDLYNWDNAKFKRYNTVNSFGL